MLFRSDAVKGLAGKMTIESSGISLAGAGNTGEVSEMVAVMKQYLPYLAAGTEVILDSGELVGTLAPKVNSEFQRIDVREKGR